MMFISALNRLAIVAVAVICGAGATTGLAQDASKDVSTGASTNASDWEAQPHAAARLIAGAALKSSDATGLRAGIEIRLDPGWKTYWRYPGDSGVPPTLDFAGSTNVGAVTVLWPAPERFDDGAGGHSIGYVGDLVIPLRITPKNAASPSSLQVKIGYAICGKLCVPAEADLALALSGRGAEEPALAAAEARVPRRVPLGAGDALAVRSVHRETDGAGKDAHERVMVDIAAPDGAPVDLLVEGPAPDWALPLPEPSAPAPNSAPKSRRFTFAVDGLPPGAKAAGAALTFTLISPDDAIEVTTHLD